MERIEQARERVMSQSFQYKAADGKVASTGPTVKMGFFTEADDGTITHLKQQGVEYELGGRIYETDGDGVISAVNTSWLRDRQAEQNDIRDHLFSILEVVMDIEDDAVLEQIFGKKMYAEIKTAHCSPNELSVLPTDSIVFAQGVSNLKRFIKARNLAPDQMLTAGGHGHKTSNKGNVPDNMDALLGINA